MSDPRRFSQDSDSDLAHTLLRSARAPAPRHARQRAVAAATSVLATTSLTATAAGGALVRVGTIGALKWVGVVGIAGLGAVSAGMALQDRARSVTERHSDEAPHQVLTASIPAVLPHVPDAPAPSPAPDPEASPAPVVAAPPVPHSAGPAASIREEVATLERASSVLASGDAALALSILGDYGSRFPRGSLASEAAVIRIEALVRAGELPAARRAAGSFLTAYPGSPYAARIRSVVGPNL